MNSEDGRTRPAAVRRPGARALAGASVILAVALAAAALGCSDGTSGNPASPTSPGAPGPGSPAPAPAPAPTPSPGATGCDRTSTGLTPLDDLGAGSYQGEQGGLYGGGRNVRPPAHDAAGLRIAREIAPLDRAGRPSSSGRYVLVSIGMSNTSQEFSTFKQIADGEPGKDPGLVIVNGAQNGETAHAWSQASCRCWADVDAKLDRAGVTPQQVAVAWIKLANGKPSGPFQGHSRQLQNETAIVVGLLETRYPNLRIAYLSSRIYGGYATIDLNPEPYAYESGFSVKWLVDDQIGGVPALNYDTSAGVVRAPWLSWGPYLWADGLRPRSDGLTWSCSDLKQDGTHPSASGERKVAEQLLEFFTTDTTAREWFLAQ